MENGTFMDELTIKNDDFRSYVSSRGVTSLNSQVLKQKDITL
jgi:hypothetical protein